MEDRDVRIDKFLWAVRLYKTRSIATAAVKRGIVLINGNPIKSSRTVKLGEVIYIKQVPIFRHFEVLQLLNNRVGAPLVANYIKDVTPKEQLDLLEATRLANGLNRRKGLGRPTKKDRRDIDSLGDLVFDDDFEFDLDD